MSLVCEFVKQDIVLNMPKIEPSWQIQAFLTTTRFRLRGFHSLLVMLAATTPLVLSLIQPILKGGEQMVCSIL